MRPARLTFASKVATGAGPIQVALGPDGASAYVTNFTDGTVSQYDVSAAGALTPKQPAVVAAGSKPAGIAVSPDGDSAYVTNQLPSGTVTQFSIAASERRPGAQGAARGRRQPAARHRGRRGRVYVANLASNTISQYAADGTGALSELAQAVGSPRTPFGLALAPDGKSLYVAAFGDAAVGQYDVAADGSLAAKADPAPANFRPQAVVAVKPRDEQAPTIDLATPADGAEYDAGRRRPGRLLLRRRGRLGPCVVQGRRARRRRAGHLDAGHHDFTVVARDGDGNETTVTHGYTVTEPAPAAAPAAAGLDFQGFLGPIHNGSVVRAGDAIPIVFSLGGNQGLDVLADSSPTSVQTDCANPGTPTGGDPASSVGGA